MNIMENLIAFVALGVSIISIGITLGIAKSNNKISLFTVRYDLYAQLEKYQINFKAFSSLYVEGSSMKYTSVMHSLFCNIVPEATLNDLKKCEPKDVFKFIRFEIENLSMNLQKIPLLIPMDTTEKKEINECVDYILKNYINIVFKESTIDSSSAKNFMEFLEKYQKALESLKKSIEIS